jgi:hypothetical protein
MQCVIAGVHVCNDAISLGLSDAKNIQVLIVTINKKMEAQKA